MQQQVIWETENFPGPREKIKHGLWVSAFFVSKRTVDLETTHIRSATTAGVATRVISRKSSPRDSKGSSQPWLEDPEIQRRHPVDGTLLDLGFLFFHSCDLPAISTWIEETLGSIKRRLIGIFT